MTDIRGSLYDIFGYFIPGVIACLGVISFIYAFSGTDTISIPAGPALLTTVLLITAYAVGHLIQALANLLPVLAGINPGVAVVTPAFKDGRDRNVVLSAAAISLLERRLIAAFGREVLSLTGSERFALIDEGRVLAGREGDREVYIYHHGLYRGLVVALAILILGAAVQAVFGSTCMSIGEVSYCPTPGNWGALIVIATAGIAASWVRLRRFAEYRVTRAVFLWLQATSAFEANHPVDKEHP